MQALLLFLGAKLRFRVALTLCDSCYLHAQCKPNDLYKQKSFQKDAINRRKYMQTLLRIAVGHHASYRNIRQFSRV